MKCVCTLGSRAPATFSESAELSCACPIFCREKFAEPTRYGFVNTNFRKFGPVSIKIIITVKSCINAAAYVQFFNFLVRIQVRLLFEVAFTQSPESAKPVKAFGHM